MTLSTRSTDMFLMESKETPTGTLVTVFHTDLSLALRGAAFGESVSNLKRVADDSTASAFREVLMTWNKHLALMLDRGRL